MPGFVLEIGCEEIPARMIDAASLELRGRVQFGVGGEILIQEVNSFSSPRRLSVLGKIVECQSDTKQWTMGPPVSAAYKDGVPTRAAEAFAEKMGVSVQNLLRHKTDKGDYVAAEVESRVRTQNESLAE